MKHIFVNLKRFDVPRSMGGVCPVDKPDRWIENVMRESLGEGLGEQENLKVVFFLPEGLIISAGKELNSHPTSKRLGIELGCQSVYRHDVQAGGNFGAFTTLLPAKAGKNLGCTWSIVGHSEERKAMEDLIFQYDPGVREDADLRKRASGAVSAVIGEEVLCALGAGLNVLLCVGETSAERGEGDFSAQKARVEAALKSQLITGLDRAFSAYSEDETRAGSLDRRIVIGYEPIWAIGPGKTPPGKDYIGYVSGCIKAIVNHAYGFEPMVVYGGGLKKENAAMIGSIDRLDGGLVALTRFSGQIGFEPKELGEIVREYLSPSR